MTLPQMVASVISKYPEDEAPLRSLLAEVGYDQSDDIYYNTRYNVMGISHLLITDDSPVITRRIGSMIPGNVQDLKYVLDLTGVNLERTDQQTWDYFATGITLD